MQENLVRESTTTSLIADIPNNLFHVLVLTSLISVTVKYLLNKKSILCRNVEIPRVANYCMVQKSNKLITILTCSNLLYY